MVYFSTLCSPPSYIINWYTFSLILLFGLSITCSYFPLSLRHMIGIHLGNSKVRWTPSLKSDTLKNRFSWHSHMLKPRKNHDHQFWSRRKISSGFRDIAIWKLTFWPPGALFRETEKSLKSNYEVISGPILTNQDSIPIVMRSRNPNLASKRQFSHL